MPWALHSLRWLLVLAALAVLGHLPAARAVTELRTLIDSDNNPATGCAVATAAGVFAGAEQVAVTRIDLSAAEPVGDVTREICQDGVLVQDASFVPLPPARWAVGIAAAGAQRDVVESYARLLAPASALRLGFAASTTDGSLAPAALLSADGSSGGAAIRLAPPSLVSVPAIGTGGLLLVACVLVLLTYRYAWSRRLAMAGSAACLLFAMGLAWAAIVRDGAPADWGATPPVATAPSTGPLQPAAVYARLEGATLHLRYDLDLGVRDGAPQDDGPYAATVGSPLQVNAPGVLANDAPSTPPAQVQEFRLPGAASSTPAGGAAAFAGSTLTVRADGSFTVAAPPAAGTFQFQYRARNRFTNGGWGTATVAVGSPAAVCGDGIRSGAEACDDGNTVTELACPYGLKTCTACNADCTQVLHLTGGYCGDSRVDSGEACDDGNNVTETSCPLGQANCSLCSADCSRKLELTGGVCGDGTVNPGEVCDDGAQNGATSCAYGTSNCSICNASCTAKLNLTGGYCGDGIKNGPEACDDGNNLSGDGCSATCEIEIR